MLWLKKKKMNKGIKHLLTEKSRVTFRVVSMTIKKMFWDVLIDKIGILSIKMKEFVGGTCKNFFFFKKSLKIVLKF